MSRVVLTIRSNAESVDPSLIPAWTSEVVTERYFAIAFIALLVYDTVITMDKEVKYFWGSPLKSVHFVYLANRYLGILGAIAFMCWNSYDASPALCNFATWSRDIANWSIIVMIDYILMIRVLALYSQDKRLVICLRTLLILEAALSLGIVIYSVVIQEIVTFRLVRDITVCGEIVILPLNWGIADWSISLVYGIILMSLALYKAYEYWRISARFKGFTLVKVLVQDQAIYFLLLISCCIFNIMQFKVAASNALLAGVLEALGNPSFLCILGCRMLINLKEAGQRGVHEDTSYRMTSISTIDFGHLGK